MSLLLAGPERSPVRGNPQKERNAPHEVSQKRPNAFGLYDMIGNVAEWTNDWADPSYYSHSPTVAPSGLAEGEAKITRGGHFLYQNHASRASKRMAGDPRERSPIGGFRCVLPDLQ
jgi:formylglycine-generating enzyme required for sulfatase activity